jgi:hypothetical protein
MERKTLAALVFVLSLMAASAVRAGPEERALPWVGILPGPEATGDAEWFVCRVLDARTREPVAGARWIRTPEWIAPWRVRHDAVLGVATTDRDGIAHLPATPAAWKAECHWLVVASGYGAAYEYGETPPPEVLLEPAVPLEGRVLDALGRPVANARVEALGGCSHGTAAAQAVTQNDGTFRIEGVGPDLGGQIWVTGRGIAADLSALDSEPSLGHGQVLLAMEPGVRYVGRVVDLLGAPVPGAVIRVHNEQRGPATRTDAEGRFVLEGAEPDSALVVFPPADLTEDESTSHVSDAHPDVPATIVVSPVGVVETEPTARLHVRALSADGSPAGGLAFRLVHAATGRGPTGWTAAGEEEDGLPEGEAIEDVWAGTWSVRPADPFSSLTFDPVVVDVGDGDLATLTVSTRPQSRLRIVGHVPSGATVDLRLADASQLLFDEEPDAAPWLPATGPAALRVEIEGRPPLFFPVGPDVEGLRTVYVELPAPRVMVLPDGARDAVLRDGERDAYAFAGDDPEALLTDATGPLLLRWDATNGTRREARVDVPVEEGAGVVVDAATARVVHEETLVRALAPDGSVFEQHEAAPGSWVEFSREGWRTLWGLAPAAGELEVRWGTVTLRLTVSDEDGPVDALALIGGEVQALPDGAVEVRGLAAGPLRVVVGRRDVVGAGQALELVLEEGEARTLEVLLPFD